MTDPTKTPLIPPVVWALLWCALAVGLLLASVYYSVIRRISRV